MQPHATLISHSSANADIAARLCALLEAQGLRCWIAPRDITPGQSYAEEIMRGIEQSATLIVLVSAQSNLSEHVLREIEQAVRLKRPIFPLFLEDVRLNRQLDYYIAPIHWLHLSSGSLERHAATLRRAIARDDAWKQDGLPPSLARTARYRPRSALVVPFAASLAAGLLVLGLAAFFLLRKESTEQARIDLHPNSLGFIALTSARGVDAGSTMRVQASVSMFAAGTRYSDLSMTVAMVDAAGQATAIDLGPFIDRSQVGGGQQFDFPLPALPLQLVTCLAMPHPRLPGRYRVTERFATRTSAADAAPQASFARVAEPIVSKEEGQPCA